MWPLQLTNWVVPNPFSRFLCQKNPLMPHFSHSEECSSAMSVMHSGTQIGCNFRLQAWMFMSWPEGRVLLAGPMLITGWGTVLLWCCGLWGWVLGLCFLLVVGFLFLLFWAKHCSQKLQPRLSHSLETHALYLVCPPYSCFDRRTIRINSKMKLFNVMAIEVSVKLQSKFLWLPSWYFSYMWCEVLLFTSHRSVFDCSSASWARSA